jgi:hypothetical protein
MQRLLCLAFLLVGCERFDSLSTTVELPQATVGHSIVVLEYYDGTWDGEHLPTAGETNGGTVRLAKPVGELPVQISWEGLDCPSNYYVAAWVDMVSDSGLDQLLAGRTLTWQDGDHDVLDKIAKLQPASGDLLGVSGPLDFNAQSGCLKTMSTNISVEPVP